MTALLSSLLTFLKGMLFKEISVILVSFPSPLYLIDKSINVFSNSKGILIFKPFALILILIVWLSPS